jgi:hypothetical protein
MIQTLKQIAIRSIGVVMFAFIPGMAIGASTPVGWFWGGVVAVAGVYSSIIIFFGVQLAWDAAISQDDIEKGFRAAVAKQANENEEVRKAVEDQLKTYDDFDDIEFQDIDDDEYDPDAVDKVEGKE